ncbi:unnamed protein product [Brassica oleracea]
MQSHWATPGHASAAKPQSPTSGDALLSPPFPPDPPDPPSHLLPLTTDVSQTQKQSVAVADTTMVQSSPENCPTITIPSLNQTEIGSHSTVPATGNPNQTSSSNPTISLSVNSTDRYKLLSPSTKSPLLTNKALNLPPPINHLPPSVQVNAATPTVQSTPHFSPYTSPPIAVLQTTSTLTDQLRIKGDKSLKRLAPMKLAENGRTRVLIPDFVFHKGAEFHKDFIICYFNGRPLRSAKFRVFFLTCGEREESSRFIITPCSAQPLLESQATTSDKKFSRKIFGMSGTLCFTQHSGPQLTLLLPLLSAPFRYGPILLEFLFTSGTSMVSV